MHTKLKLGAGRDFVSRKIAFEEKHTGSAENRDQRTKQSGRSYRTFGAISLRVCRCISRLLARMRVSGHGVPHMLLASARSRSHGSATYHSMDGPWTWSRAASSAARAFADRARGRATETAGRASGGWAWRSTRATAFICAVVPTANSSKRPRRSIVPSRICAGRGNKDHPSSNGILLEVKF